MKLRRAMIFVKDMERMTAFYRDQMGLTPIEGSRSPDWIEFDTGGMTTLALHAIPPEVAKGITIEESPRTREETPIKLVFSVTDVKQTRELLLARGVTMFALRSFGACDGIDAEGNVFQLVSEG